MYSFSVQTVSSDLFFFVIRLTDSLGRLAGHSISIQNIYFPHWLAIHYFVIQVTPSELLNNKQGEKVLQEIIMIPQVELNSFHKMLKSLSFFTFNNDNFQKNLKNNFIRALRNLWIRTP